MNRKVVVVILALTLVAVCCVGCAENECARACWELGLDYGHSTEESCTCLRGGEEVEAWQ